MADKNNIYFAGGKLILMDASNGGDEGFKLEKEDDESWTLSIKAKINKEAAENVIMKFSDLGVVSGKEPASNMPNVAGLDDDGKAMLIPISANSTIVPTFFQNTDGILNVKLVIPMGKTQNGKTQNVEV